MFIIWNDERYFSGEPNLKANCNVNWYCQGEMKKNQQSKINEMFENNREMEEFHWYSRVQTSKDT